ncbi:GNAT family N-acetyltransferase [uncultured Streptomyces sp.]|uniref:GNAT family N-acetyltransferase n=1 Tax=uncultured Streptomyces sp. TaxID=174707 RepID=UPI002638943E|nr:GNAT family N-acetyltransferase [uncultured Streptomyces sp.]
MDGTSLRTAHTYELSPQARTALRALLDTAFDGEFDDEDWDHGLGGIHAWAADASGPLAHGSVVQRRVAHHGVWYRVGYVEAVAVRADRRREGLGGRVMAALERVIEQAYDFGALGATDDGAALYRARGWRLWEGPAWACGPGGTGPLSDDEQGCTYLWPTAARPLPQPPEPLVFDWRGGDVL